MKSGNMDRQRRGGRSTWSVGRFVALLSSLPLFLIRSTSIAVECVMRGFMEAGPPPPPPPSPSRDYGANIVSYGNWQSGDWRGGREGSRNNS